MISNAKLFCAACECVPEVVTDVDGKLKVVCDGCGQKENLEDAMWIAREHFKYMAAVEFQDATRSAVRGRKSKSREAKPLAKREFGWAYVSA